MTYSEKLKDPRWLEFRREFIHRRYDPNIGRDRCDECGEDTQGALHVHHRLYRDGADPWEYEDDELRLLCEECHERIHRTEEQARNLIRSIPPHVCYEFKALLDELQECFRIGDHSLKIALARCKNEARNCFYAQRMTAEQEAALNKASDEFEARMKNRGE